MLAAALGILDEDNDQRVEKAVVHQINPEDLEATVEIDWAQLEENLVSSSEALRVQIARSLLDGTPVSLQGLEGFGSATYGLLMHGLGKSWPDAPPDLDELFRGGA